MKIIIAAALFSFAFAGFAAAGEMEGTVKSVDMDKHMITMQDGMSVTTDMNVKLDHLMAGDHVKVTTDGSHMGTMVEKMK